MSKSSLHRLTGFLILQFVVCNISIAQSEEMPRRGYSYFSLGYDLLDYEENTARQFGGKTVDIETESSLNLTQQTGAYVAVNPDWGFYLTSSSTLGNPSADEEWQIDGITVTTNKISFERERLGFIASYRMKSTDYFLFGAQYNSNEFKRFATTLTAAAASFGIDENSLTTGTTSENVWDLSMVVGYESNTIFSSNKATWEHLIQVTFGVPVVTNISNTEVNDGASFSENFNGFQLRLNIAMAYHFNQNAGAIFGLDMGYSQRNSISREFIDIDGTTEFPPNVLFYFYPNVAIAWSF